MSDKIFFLLLIPIIALLVSGNYDVAAQQPVSPYDLNGDGIVNNLDLDMYRDMFHAINFNGDVRVDIFDQVMIAAEIVTAQDLDHEVYLPLITK